MVNITFHKIKKQKSECLYFTLFLFVFRKKYIILEKIPYYKRKIKKFIYKKFIYDIKTPQILSEIGCYNNIRFLNLTLVIGKL